MAEELVGAYGGRLIVAVLGVGLALVCLIAILWIVRGRRGPSPFVRGGRNRQPRLQVLDAAAVDARRRLVLVRRDDVEHLIMIGGPSDIVIESRIPPSARPSEARSAEQPATHPGLASAAARPAAVPPGPAAQPAQSPRAAEAIPRPETPAPSAPAVPMREPRPVQPVQPAGPVPVAASAPPPLPARVEPKAIEPAMPLPAPASPLKQDLPERPVRPAPAVASVPALDDAARLLDSARDRVFAEGGTRQAAATPPVIRPAAQAASSPAAAKPLGSDFERILEEEMASNLAAQQASGATARLGTSPAQPQENARMDPAMQAEVNRIFGDMSASRDK